MQSKILQPAHVKMWEVRTDGWWRSQAEDQDLAFVRFTFIVSYNFIYYFVCVCEFFHNFFLFSNKKSLPVIFGYETVNSLWICTHDKRVYLLKSDNRTGRMPIIIIHHNDEFHSIDIHNYCSMVYFTHLLFHFWFRRLFRKWCKIRA